MPAFGYPKKLIIVRKSGLFKKQLKNKNDVSEKFAEYIEKNIDLINEAVVLIFVEEEIQKNNLVKIIEKLGKVQEFKKLSANEAVNAIIKICSQYQVKIDKKTAMFFIETCGQDMQNLINEVRKLIEYVGKDGTITEDTIKLLSIKQLDSVIFDLTDCLGKKNVGQALQILKELVYNKEPVQKILITLYGHFRKLYITKLSLELNKDVVESLSLKPNQMFLVSKYKTQAKYFTKEELRKILDELIELDNNSKQGLIDVNVGLEAILCAIL